MVNKYRQALEEVLMNLRSIEAPNSADEYIDDSIKVIIIALERGCNDDKADAREESRTN